MLAALDMSRIVLFIYNVSKRDEDCQKGEQRATTHMAYSSHCCAYVASASFLLPSHIICTIFMVIPPLAVEIYVIRRASEERSCC